MTFESITWAPGDGEYNSHPLLIRFREFPPNFPKAKYPERLNIFWKMSAIDQNGLPAADEFNKLSTFEDRLVEAIEHDEHSVLTGVLTCNGKGNTFFIPPTNRSGAGPVRIHHKELKHLRRGTTVAGKRDLFAVGDQVGDRSLAGSLIRFLKSDPSGLITQISVLVS